MKRILFLIILFLFTGMLFWSCSDEGGSEPENQGPTCTITYPPDNIKYSNCVPLIVRLDADDIDNNIRELRLYVDYTYICTDDEYPYSFNVSTSNFLTGNHIISVIAEDDYGKTFADSIEIFLTDAQFDENLYYGGLMALCQNFLPHLVDSEWIEASEIYNYDYFSNRNNWEYQQLDSLDVTDMLTLSFTDWNGTYIDIEGSPLMFVHNLPDVQTDEYFILVGKYLQFSCGWDDFQGYERDIHNYILMDSLFVNDSNDDSVLVIIPSLKDSLLINK